MNRFTTWLGISGGVLLYCHFRPDYMTIDEIAAAIYFSGGALALHWLQERRSR